MRSKVEAVVQFEVQRRAVSLFGVGEGLRERRPSDGVVEPSKGGVLDGRGSDYSCAQLGRDVQRVWVKPLAKRGEAGV